MSLHIRNCRVVSPGVDLPGASIEISGDRIEGVRPEGDRLPPADRVYDARGLTALPGFIDIHVHGGGGYDVSDGTTEALERIAEAKLAEGVTAFCPTTLTLPPDQLVRCAEAVAACRAKATASRILGVHLEGPFISPSMKGAHNPAHIRKPDMNEVKRLHAVSPLAIVTFAVEEEGGLELTAQLAAAGIVPSLGHSAATFEQIAAARRRGLGMVAHFGNQISALHHRSVGGVGAGLLDDGLLLEVICDGKHLSPEMISLVFKVKPIEKIALVTDAIRATGQREGAFDLGGQEIYLRDGAAYLRYPDVLAGSLLTFPEALKNALRITGLPLGELVKTTSENQARLLGIEDRGRIAPGYLADIVLLDPSFRVRAVFVDGEQRYGKGADGSWK